MLCCPAFSAKVRTKARPTAATAVTVIVLEQNQKRVAGLDAAVLAADDADALASWLKEHGYATRDALGEGGGVEPYIATRWIVTTRSRSRRRATATPG